MLENIVLRGCLHGLLSYGQLAAWSAEDSRGAGEDLALVENIELLGLGDARRGI